VREPAVVTEVSLTGGIESGLVRLENLPPAKLPEPGDKLDDKHSIENVLKVQLPCCLPPATHAIVRIMSWCN